MNEQAIQEQYQHIVSLLEQKRLKEAQVQLEAFLWNCNDWTLRSRLEQAKMSYQYMLQYMRQGVNDPERQKLYRQLLAETWEIAEQTRVSLLDEVSTHYYHALNKNKRNMVAGYGMSSWLKVLESFQDDMAVCQLMPDNKKSLDSALKRHEETAQYLFLTTWGNSGWTTEEEQEAKTYLDSELLPVHDLCLFTGAILLSLMECFDPRKFSWLLDATMHADTQVSQRALVVLAIVLHIHSNRLWLYPELEARLLLLNEDGSFGKQLNRIYIQLLRSQETEKIDKKMREEIIPEMMKNVSIMRNMKYGFDYQRYVTEELPVICRNMFNISAAREDTGIMGCSMGGYGALRCALTHPDSYGFVGAFSSGPLFARAGMEEIKKYGDLPDYAERFGLRLIKDFKAIYGESLELTDDAEILDMLLKVKAENKLPRIYLTCGKDDAFMKEHELFTGALDKMGIPYEFDKLEGAHEFQCFNEALKRAIARFEGR